MLPPLGDVLVIPLRPADAFCNAVMDPWRPRRSASTPPPERGEPHDEPNTGEAGPQGMLSRPETMGEGGTDELMPPPARALGREAVRAEREDVLGEPWESAST